MRIIPDSDGEPIGTFREAWSDAARSAAAAARRLRGKGLAVRRDAARNAYFEKGVRDFQLVPAASLHKGDRIFSSHNSKHLFNVSRKDQARARGYLVVQGKNIGYGMGGGNFFGTHQSTPYTILRNKKYGPASLAVTATGRRRRGKSFRSR